MPPTDSLTILFQVLEDELGVWILDCYALPLATVVT